MPEFKIAGYLIKVFLLAGFLVVLAVLIRFLESKNLYFPLRAIEATPQDMNLDYDDVYIMTEDRVRLAGWYIPLENNRAVVIFFHGNGGNISHRLEKIKIFNDLNLDVMIFDYRGYGMSKGTPSEEGLYLDAEAVYDYLINNKKVAPEKIMLYGESLGGAVAVVLAEKHRTGGIIIEGAFTSIKDMAKRVLPFIPAFVYKNKYDSLEKIKSVKIPKLILHSVDDEIVPFEFGMKLFDAAPEPKGFVELRGGHNDAFLISQKVFIEKIDRFIKSLSADRQA